ncbi:MAG: penicillin acylase family protein, partial [Dehalococcoidia bacterium]|nr:penicillin acylase family protein [Dehalococcoidia bacterium]
MPNLGTPSPPFSRLRLQATQAMGVAKALVIAAGSSAHPQVQGRISVDGLAGPVEIRRDHAGVPHIFAESDEDALFGQGFVHAQDRLFQIDGMRRLAGGRVAEVTGAGSLEADRFMRRLGLAGRAADDWRRADDRERRLLGAHARGMNAGVLSLPALPP